MVKQCTVTFSQPMVALGDMSLSPDQSPMEITPPMPGQFRWLNVYTLTFEPDTPLEGSLSGTVRIKSGVRSLSGATLDQEVTAEYNLPRIIVNSTYPEPGSSGLSLRPTFRIVFNQPLIHDSLAGRIFFSTDDNPNLPAKIIDTVEANKNRKVGEPWVVVTEPVQDLTPDTKFYLNIQPGLQPFSGSIASAETYSYHYNTYGPLEVQEITGYRENDNSPLDPESSLGIRFSNDIVPKDILKFIKISPDYDLTRLEDYGYIEEETSTLWLPGPFLPEKTYTFSFLEGLKDINGQTLTGDREFKVTLGPARPILDVPGRQGVLESTSKPFYPYLVRNVSQVKLRGFLLEPEEAIPFIMQSRMFSYRYESEEDLLAKVDRAKIKTSVVKIKNPPNVATWEPVKLDSLFGPDINRGLMYFDLQSPETNVPNTKQPYYYRSMVQITNIGLSAKFGQTNTLVWTTDLDSGQPLPGVKLEIRNRENVILWRGLSDQQGLATAPGAETFKVADYENVYGEPTLFVMAFHDDRFSMISTEWNQGISPWNYGLSTRELNEKPEIMTYVLTALPLYKPGDEVQFKVIQRQDINDALSPPTNKKIKVKIEDSRGRDLDAFDLDVTKFGTASAKFQLARDASLGWYSIRVGPDENNMRYSGSFQVEMYRKPTFAVTVTPKAESGIVGDTIDTAVKAVYHFGAPVKEQKVAYNVTATSAEFSLPRFDRFTISDYYSDPEEPDESVPTIAQGQEKLDAEGSAHLTFQASAGTRPVPRNFEIEATVTDVDGRTVSQRKSVLVHPASFYLGLMPNSYLVTTGQPIWVNVVAATPDSELVNDIPATLVLYRRTWQTVRRKGVGGYYEYISKITDDVVERKEIKTGRVPTSFSFQADKPGFYYLAANAEDQAHRAVASSVGFYCYGSGAAGWEHYDHDRIDLVADRAEYSPGDTATIMVKSPFTQGTGLLTIERNGVRHHEIFKIESSSPTLQVQLGEPDSPNVFVSVLLVRGRISEELDEHGRDPGKPAFKAGYVELTVKDDHKRLQVAVVPNRLTARPGEDMQIDLEVKDSKGQPREAEVALIVADAALLQLSSEDVYYPERFFFASRALAVWTSDLRLNLIGRRHYGLKGAQPGGGGQDLGGDKYRRKFVSLAYFEPHLVTDASGKASVKFKLPDNLTTFKIFAVTNTDGERFGTGKNEFVVTQPLLVKPALPNFAGIGDRFRASVVVHNQSDASGQATVRLAGENFDIIDAPEQIVDISPKSSQEVGYWVKIRPGSEAVFRFSLALGNEKDAAEYRIPLRYPNVMQTSATYGRLTETMSELVRLPEGSDANRGDLKITVSPSLAGSANYALEYLDAYPYQCLEQKISKAMGRLFQITWKDRLAVGESDVEKARQAINTLLSELSSFQDYQGGFSFWPDYRESDPFLSGYVLQFMTYAKGRDFEVDQTVLDRSIEYITNVLNQDRWPVWYGASTRLAAKTYLVSVLAEAGRPVAPMLEVVYQQRKKMAPYELSLLLKTLGLAKRTKYVTAQIEDVNNRLFGLAVFSSGEVHFEEGRRLYYLMGSTVRTNAAALSALLTAVPENPHIVPLARWLMREQKDGHWGNTQNNAVVLKAVSDYLEVFEKTPPDFKVDIAVMDKVVGGGTFTSFNSPMVQASTPNSTLGVGKDTDVRLTHGGSGGGYYSLHLKYAKEKPDLSAKQAGFAVVRTYSILAAGTKTAQTDTLFKRGDIVQVTLTLLVPSDRHWVVLQDQLPAGLEPINFSLRGSQESLLDSLSNSNENSYDYYTKYWYQHLEMWQDKVAVFARGLREGAYSFSYLARVVTPGSFIAPGAHVEEMYSPEVYGQGEGVEFEVRAD
jgi:hypothetical protein